MRTRSLKLPKPLDMQLESYASRRRVSKSSVVREALSHYLTRELEAESFAAQARDLAGTLTSARDLSFNKRHLKGYGRSNRRPSSTRDRSSRS